MQICVRSNYQYFLSAQDVMNVKVSDGLWFYRGSRSLITAMFLHVDFVTHNSLIIAVCYSLLF